MRNKIELGILNDYYGGLLTTHQREVVRLYCDCDMSLAEISDELNISREAVRDVISRTEAKLSEFESKLGIIIKVRALTARLEDCLRSSDDSSKEEILKELSTLLVDIKEI